MDGPIAFSRLNDEAGRFYIVTGGPGSGKSSLISSMALKGFPAMPEAGRAIIQDQVMIGGSALPWENRLAFAELMLSWELRSYKEAVKFDGPVFFDRGVPDVTGYLRLCGLEVPAHIWKAAQCFRYNKLVFLAPPWEAIYCLDVERRQSWAEAVATAKAMTDVYEELGYEVCLLPLVSVEERVEFVLQTAGCIN